MNHGEIVELCGLTRLLYNLLNEFLQRHDGGRYEGNIGGMNDFINKCIDTCKKIEESGRN